MNWVGRRLARLREETPGCLERIHFDNAGAGLMANRTRRQVTRHLELESRIGGYQAAEARGDEISQAYRTLAALLRASDRNIAFVENATSGYIQALSAIPFGRGDTIVTTLDDYVSNQIMFLSLKRRWGLEIRHAPNTPRGEVDLQALERMIESCRPRLVALTHVPTNSGLVQPAAAVGEICRRQDVYYLLDACQSVGQMPLDVGELKCDFLSATSRKFLRGPRGAGVLYVSDRILDEGLYPLFIDLHGAEWTDTDSFRPRDDARRFENWEFAWALILGMAEAARAAQEIGLEAIHSRCTALGKALREGLDRIPGVRVTDQGRNLCAIVTAQIDGWEDLAFKRALLEQGLNVSISYRSYARLHYNAETDWTLRASPHYYNTEEEVERFCNAVAALARQKTAKRRRGKGSW